MGGYLTQKAVRGGDKVKIGFDISQTAENKAGCGFFAEQIIDHLLEIDQSNKYLLYSVFYNYRHPNFKNAYRSKAPNADNIFQNHSWREVNNIWNNTEPIENSILGSPEIIHANNFTCPKDVKAKKVVTIYDVGFLDFPEFTTEENRLVCFNGTFEASIYADHIVTISDFSKRAFLKYFPHYPEDRVSVVYLGSRPSLQIQANIKNRQEVLNKYRINGEFWLGVGTIEPRKNYRLLLKAYAKMVHEENEKRHLVIAGGGGWLEDDIQEEVKRLGISHQTFFLGYVSDEDLAPLYSSCFGFVYPSCYEGFGLPVLEAMSCGAPVITSNVTSLPEVAGDAALYIDPASSDSLFIAMKTLNNAGLRDEMKQKSFQQSAKFSWKKAAKEMLQIYNKVLECETWFRMN